MQPHVLLVSKPIVPPWTDSAKNLVRDLAGNGRRYHYHLLGTAGGDTRDAMPPAAPVLVEPIYATSGSFSPSLSQNFAVLRRLLRPDDCPLYHFFFAPNPRTSIVARALFAIKRRRVVHTVCSAPLRYDGLKWLNFADVMVTISAHTASRCRAAGVGHVRSIAPGIAPTAPVSVARKSAIRTQLNLSDAPLLLFAGDYEFSMAADRALAIAERILPRSDAQVVFACRTKTPESRSIEDALRVKARQMGLGERIHFVGHVDDMPALLAITRLNLMLADSLYAKMDYPLVLLEGMALGVPILVGDQPPINEIVQMGRCGLAHPLNELAGAADLALRLLVDDDAHGELSQGARDLAQSRFDIRQIVQEYEALYDGLLGAR